MKIFYDLKLGRCPRSLFPTLVTLPSMSLIPFAPFSDDDIGSVFDFTVLVAPEPCAKEDPLFRFQNSAVFSNALLSLPVLVAVATVAGESSLLAKTFGVRSLDLTPILLSEWSEWDERHRR